MKSYSTARTFIGVIEVIGWITVILSLIACAAIVLRGGLGPLALAIPSVVTGLAIVTIVQITRAQIDTAENTGRILELLEATIHNQKPPRGNATEAPEKHENYRRLEVTPTRTL